MIGKELIAIDVTIPAKEIKTDGTAFYRIDPGFRDFLIRCLRTHGVIGFSYDFESLNFGVVLASSEKEIVDETKVAKEKELVNELKEKEKDIKKKGEVN